MVCSVHFEGNFTAESIPTIFPSKPIKEVKTRRLLIRHATETSNRESEIDCNNNSDETIENSKMLMKTWVISLAIVMTTITKCLECPKM